MFILNARNSILGTIAIGVGAFGLTAATITVASAQATPAPSPTAASSPSTFELRAPVPEIPIGEVERIASGQDISFPVDSYRADPAVQNFVLKAEYAAMKACMSRFGLGFAPPPESWTVPSVNHDYDRLFGLIDLREAQQYGYHTGERLLPNGEAMPNSTPARDPNDSEPNYLTVAVGDPAVQEIDGVDVPEGGCITEARSSLADDGTAQALYEAAINYGLQQSDADPRVASAFASWSACMAASGYKFSTPMAAINASEWATPVPSEVEIAVATADVSCKAATDLTGLRAAVAAAWQNYYIAEHAAEFAAVKSNIEQQVALATSILR